ncbi:MAG: aminotransferase class V-fold PLP-dependent enzyme [Flammeovirgaceae bacterium]|nr:aminotransferase class V-fold PLP-dependent enzyme [Flammeovirgaceae bacterium]
MIAFSHVSNVSGIKLPAKEICQLAMSKNILTLVDGAQTVGFMDLNVNEMGCSFYTSSTHKWLMGPMENGILYARSEHHDKIWPGIVGGGWRAGGKTLDERICVLGQRNDPTTAGIPSMVDFHNLIGKKNIEDRVVSLNTALKKGLTTKIPSIKFVTPIDSSMSGGIVISNIPGKDAKELVPSLYKNAGIACAASGGIRLSPHVYNTMSDIEKVVDALAGL